MVHTYYLCYFSSKIHFGPGCDQKMSKMAQNRFYSMFYFKSGQCKESAVPYYCARFGVSITITIFSPPRNEDLGL